MLYVACTCAWGGFKLRGAERAGQGLVYSQPFKHQGLEHNIFKNVSQDKFNVDLNCG